MQKFIGTAAALAMVATAFAASSLEIDIQKLDFAAGFVTAVDKNAGTVTVDGMTYSAKKSELREINPGLEVQIWFEREAGGLTAAAVEPKWPTPTWPELES